MVNLGVNAASKVYALDHVDAHLKYFLLIARAMSTYVQNVLLGVQL